MTFKQTSFDWFKNSIGMYSPRVLAAIETLSAESGKEVRGAIFTRLEVVNFILDLVGYTKDQHLFKKQILEPSFGGGDFLLPIIERLLASWRDSKERASVTDALEHAICAVEIHRETFEGTRELVIKKLVDEGIKKQKGLRLQTAG